MKPLLPRDRAASAVPTRPLARAVAWAKESLLARALALVAGLFALALIGSSASAARSLVQPDAPAAASSAAPPPASPVVDAGVIPTTRPESLPRAAPEPPSDILELDAPSPATHARGGNAPASLPRATPDSPVDLNAAGLDDLRRLPGIGAKRAEAVLALRAKLPGGRFHHLEELLKVKGVGRAMIKRWHPLVTIGVEGT